MRTPGAASASAISSSRAVTRLTRTPAGRSTLNKVTVGPATQPTTLAMILKSSSVSWRQAPVSCSSESVARSFSGSVDVARRSNGGSSKPCSGRGVATGVAAFEGFFGIVGAAARSIGLRRPSLRVMVSGVLLASSREAPSSEDATALPCRRFEAEGCLSIWVLAVSSSASSGSSTAFAFGRETLANAGAGTTPRSRSSASSRAAASARSFSTMLDTEKPMTINPAIARPNSTIADITLPNNVRPHHAMPAPI